MKRCEENQKNAAAASMNEPVKKVKKKRFKKKIVIGIGLLCLFFIVTGIISELSPPTKPAMSNLTQDGYAKIELDQGVYTGDVSNQMFTGKGEFRFLDGTIYSGSWQDSKMSGDGTCSYPGVGVYTGEYDGAVRSGTGSFHWENGDSYTGKWKEDAMTEGTYTFAGGSSYTGSFSGGKPVDGTVSYLIPKEDTTVRELTLTFEAGRASHIIYQLSNGFSYDGSLQDGGSASITYENGDTYSGNVSNGLKEGKGIYIWKKAGKQAAKYEGMWKKNAMSGKGVYYYTGKEYPTLSGTFKNGHPNGTCTYTKEAGSTFTAIFKNGTCTSIK